MTVALLHEVEALLTEPVETARDRRIAMAKALGVVLSLLLLVLLLP